MEQIANNPQAYGLPPNPEPEAVERAIAEVVSVPPDRPIWEAYTIYMQNVIFDLNFGTSYIVSSGDPVLPLLAEVAPWTVFISSIGLVYGLFVGIILGSIMAYYEGTKFDVGMTGSMLLSAAVPYYVAAIVLLYFFAYQLGLFPTGGRVNPDLTPGYNWPFIKSVFYHAALPSLSFVITGFGGGALGMRANAIRILGSDYIKAAELRGLSSYKISTRYLARNAVLPMYTGIVIGIGGLLGGSVIMETIYGYRGMGMLMYQATVARDFPVLTAGLIITTCLFVMGTLLADFTYALIDPRAEQSSMG